jgi:glycosyltransferase involved in cell wall biosynthesis
MFVFDVPALPERAPEPEPLWDRLARLTQGSSRVAYLYPRPNAGTFRYRVLNMIEALATVDPSIAATWFSGEELGARDRILERADLIVICHAKYDRVLADLVARARGLGKPVLYDIDDLVFDIRYVHLVLDYLDHPTREDDFDYWFADFARYGALMLACDRVILTNAYLAERAEAFSGLPTRVVPNFMNQAQLTRSASILERKRHSGFARDGRIHLGYFSGSPTHRRDFAVLEDAVLDLLDRDPRVVLRVVGFLELDERFAPFAERIETFPLQDPIRLQELIGEVELNLVPLHHNPFTECKSELKVFEAGAVGTISLASPAFTLRRAIRDGETGYLAPSHAWRETLDRAIQALDAYPDMALAAADAVLQRDTPAAQGPRVVEALFGEARA